MKKWLDNYNDSSVSTGPGFVGMGNDTTGRNYSPAWGGQFAMGGTLPGATGMMYARTINPAPSNGKYAKKTKASAQDGKSIQQKRYNELYAPIENKVFDAIGTQDSYDILPYSTKDFLNKTIAGFSVSSNRNIPPMDPIIKEVQDKVQKLPKEELTKLLNTNWSKMGLAGAMKNTPSSVSYLDMLKYVNHFNKLKKKGYTLQNGGEMKFYQEGLDFKPKTISEDGSIIDPMGQWAHPGKVTTIPGNDITMKGVPYPVLGVSDKGDKKLMKPGKDYKFKGSKVTEYPIAEFGDYFQDSGQAQIGGAVGEAAGNALFGPLGGMAGKLLGNVAGNLLGGAADANKLVRYQGQTQANAQRAAMQQSLQSGQFSSFMKNGGWLDKYK